MAHGGKRPGAGRRVGSRNRATKAKAKAEVEDEYRQFMLREREALWRAQRERACGVYVLLVKTETGYQRVTDPDEIAAQPATRCTTHWLIEAQAAETTLAKEINNRVMGVPKQTHEVGGTDGPPMAITIVHEQIP